MKNNPIAYNEWLRRQNEWGEKGPAHNVDYKITDANKHTIVMNSVTGNVPATSMEEQKRRSQDIL